MAERQSSSPENRSGLGVSVVSSMAAELRDAIIEIAGPPTWFENRKSWLARAARTAGIPHRTAKAIFYREVGDPRASVVEKIRSARAGLHAAQEKNEAKARDEYRILCERIAQLEARLRDPQPAHRSGAWPDVGDRRLDVDRARNRSVGRIPPGA